MCPHEARFSILFSAHSNTTYLNKIKNCSNICLLKTKIFCLTSNTCIRTDQFQCAHGKKCIDKEQVCDDVAQCQDRSDELHCLKQTEGCIHHCDNKGRCLPANLLCDGERDCLDGTDEANCGKI